MTSAAARWATALAGFVVLSVLNSHLAGQAPAPAPSAIIQSSSGSGEGLVVGARSDATGQVTFATAAGNGLLVTVSADLPPAMRARSFLETYGGAFGVASAGDMQVVRADVDDLGLVHVRFQQTHLGVNVTAAELIVHLKGTYVVAVNGHLLPDLPSDVTPHVPAAIAEAAARGLIEKHFAELAPEAAYTAPRLEILNRALLSDPGPHSSQLAWFVEATGPGLRHYIWVDALTGDVILDFSQLPHAKRREVYTAGRTDSLPGTLVRSEGGAATGDADQDNAYQYSGIAYDYFLANHGRDSFDNAGATLKLTTHYCPGAGCSTATAFWNGNQVVFSDGYASADDVVAHEITHAITERSAGLFYYMQSGALNESLSDMFGEAIDLADGVGNDTSSVRWRLGEDLPGGAIRNMMSPNNYNDPGRMGDGSFYCNQRGYTDAYGDGGGVHTNSGVPNHAFALMVDGGTYNGTTIAAIGLTKATKIQYRALTVYLTSGSGFLDYFHAVNQSCADLVGTEGIATSDCGEVHKALLAVEMNAVWGCSAARQAPLMCPGGTPVISFVDGFEQATSQWSATSTAAGAWSARTSGFAATGQFSAYGSNPNTTSDHRLTMASGVALPAGARLYFDHAFEFESGFFAYDGGVLEYSTDSGSTWIDAGSLIEAGRNYGGSVSSFGGNPLGGRSAFVYSSYGYTGTRLYLGSLVGQTVRFRFRVGTDGSHGSLGWLVDNVKVYTCSADPSGRFYVGDSSGRVGTVDVSARSSSRLGDVGTVLTDIAMTASGRLFGIDFDNLYSINPVTGRATFVGSLGARGMNALVGYGDGLLAASSANTSLYSVNTSTGAATPWSGSLGYASAGDLVFHNDTLYAAVVNNGYSDLVKVTLAGSSFTAVNLGHVLGSPTLYGLAVGADRNLYGLADRVVLLINPAVPSQSTPVVADYGLGANSLGTANGATSLTPFADELLTARISIVRWYHITDLRGRIDAARARAGLGAYAWTDAGLTPGSSTVRAIHILDLRQAIAEIYGVLGRSVPAFTDPALGRGTVIKAAHILELRTAILLVE